MTCLSEETEGQNELPVSAVFFRLIQLEIFIMLRCHILGWYMLNPISSYWTRVC